MTLRALAVAALILLPLVGACRRGPTPAGALTVVDDAGDTVEVPAPATRVVSLIPASTELLFAIGAGDLVVGRTQWCQDPPAATAVPSLGDGIAPNIEAIVGTRPDLVLLYRSARNADAVRRLRGLGIAAIQLRTDSLADVPRWARLLGRLTGHERSADSLAEAFAAELEAASVPPGGERPSVFILAWEQPPMTIGSGSFLSELLERAGGRNLFEDVVSADAPVSIEAVAVRDPDLILTLGSGEPAFARRPEWQAVPAVRARRILRVEGTEFSHPGPRAPAAIRSLARALASAAP